MVCNQQLIFTVKRPWSVLTVPNKEAAPAELKLMHIITQQNDTVDLICHRVYGDTSMLAAVLDTNPELAELGAILPMGIRVELPEYTAPVAKTINLWD